MSYITDILISGLSGPSAEFLNGKVEAYWDEIYGDDPETFPPGHYQRLVDVSEHAGGHKGMGCVLAAAFNYGPPIDDWQAWIDEAIEAYKPYSLFVLLDNESSDDVRVFAHGKWVEQYATPCERDLERCQNALVRIASLDHQTASAAPTIAQQVVGQVTA